MVPGLLAGQISATTAAERFLVAIVVCWIFGAILSWVITTYSEQARRAQLMRMINESRQNDSQPGPQGHG
jgi:hypothetical protein